MQSREGLRHASLFVLALCGGVAGSLAACGTDSSSNGASAGAAAGGEPGDAGHSSDGGDGGSQAVGGTTAGEGGTMEEGGTASPGAAASGGEPAAGEASGGSPDVPLADPPAKYLKALSPWGSVPATTDTPSAPATEKRQLQISGNKKWPFNCQIVKHDITARHDEILNFDSGAEYIKPGVLLVGSEFKKGNLQPIPLPRAPITLSINVPGVTMATVKVTNPNVSNIQQGIATLQAQAQTAAKGSYAAQLSYEQHSVQSSEEMAYKLGVAGSFDGLFASANFSAKFSNEDKQEKYTVASKLLQQMYTITFAQDQFVNARDFFSPSMTLEQLLSAEQDGYLGADDPPVFIGSVTYGRMVVFTATSTEAHSSTELETALQAAGSTWSASANLTMDQQKFVKTLDYDVLSVGGNQTNVTTAIQTGDWSQLYAGADILNSVPLRYTVHALSGTRPIAAIGDTTSFTSSDCSAIEGWYDVTVPANVSFTDISTNPKDDPVYAVGVSGGSYRPYKLDGNSLVADATYSSTGALDVTVDDIGNAFLYDPVTTYPYRNAAGGGSWAVGDKMNGNFMSFDAGAADWLVGFSITYSDNQNDFYQTTWPTAWAYWIDEAQNIKSNAAPWYTAVGKGYIARHGDYLYRRQSDGPIYTLSTDVAELNTVQKLSAASADELYAVRTGAGGDVTAFNPSSKKFDKVTAPPAGTTISQLEATSNGRFWIIASDGKVHGYAPPR